MCEVINQETHLGQMGVVFITGQECPLAGLLPDFLGATVRLLLLLRVRRGMPETPAPG